MLVVCRPGLDAEDFRRLESRLSAQPHELRWAQRAGRLVLLLEKTRADQEDWQDLVGDPAVEYVLRDPSVDEITRVFSRRDLLNLSLTTTGLLAAVVLLGPVGLFVAAPAGLRTSRGDLLMGSADSIPIGGSQSRVIDGEEYVIVRRDETRFYALSATCTHSNVCLVSWDKKRGQLVCPCHRGIFDVYGNVVAGPPPRPLSRLDVTVRDGNLYVRRPG